MREFEFEILDFIQKHMASEPMNYIMKFFTFLGDAGWIWISLTIVLLCTKKYRKTGIMLSLGLLIGLITASGLLKPLIGRLRPFQLRETAELIIKAPHDFSFPSGHTTASVICATIICLNHKNAGIPVCILAALISFSRMYLYVHFPTDVLGGLVLGIATALLSVKLVNKFSQKF